MNDNKNLDQFKDKNGNWYPIGHKAYGLYDTVKVIVILGICVSLTLTGLIVWAVVHFISKYW